MKKNLVVMCGLVAGLSLIACKEKEDENKQDNTDVVDTELKCSDVKSSDFNDGCIKCAANDETVLVCGVCAAADAATDGVKHVKRQCTTAVEGATTEFSQTLVCNQFDSVYLYRQDHSTTCLSIETCNHEEGICKVDPNKVDECSNSVTFTCDGNKLVPHMADGCSDAASDLQYDTPFDCSNYGGCDSEAKACVNMNDKCDQGEKAVSKECVGDVIVTKNLDRACSEGRYEGSLIDSEKSCLSLTSDGSVWDGESNVDLIVGTCEESANGPACVPFDGTKYVCKDNNAVQLHYENGILGDSNTEQECGDGATCTKCDAAENCNLKCVPFVGPNA